MRTKIKKIIEEIKEAIKDLLLAIVYLMPLIVPYIFIKLVFHTSHIQTFIIVLILLIAITKALDFIATLLDAEIDNHIQE